MKDASEFGLIPASCSFPCDLVAELPEVHTMISAANDPRIRYALAVLLDEHPEEFSWPEWIVYDANWPKGLTRGVQIIPSGFFGEMYGTARSLPEPPLPSLEASPVLFGGCEVQETSDRIVVTADILASAYFLLTRYEEWVRPEVRDIHGRFPGKESLAYRGGFIDRPVVHEYQKLLEKWGGRVGVRMKRSSWQFSVVISHDVDNLGCHRGVWPAIRSLGGFLLSRRSWHASVQLFQRRLGLVNDPTSDLSPVLRSGQDLIRHAGKERVRQIFFFKSGGSDPLDRGYKIESLRAREAIGKVLAEGAEIGLHTSYEAGGTPDLIASERRTLEDVAGVPITLNRHHFLRWCEPVHGFALANSGIRSDYTLGYADIAGFRLGVCRPVRLFDPSARRLQGIEEHPLIVMDCSLARPQYMNLNEEQAFACVCDLIERVVEHSGEFVMLWHHDVVCPISDGYHPRLYPRVLNYLAGRLTGELPPRRTGSMNHRVGK